MERFSVSIVGAGPRGLAVLERLSALINASDARTSFDIHVVDPGRPGQGIHRETQPDHLLTNTAAGSTTAFVDHSVTDAGPPRPGPSLSQWLAQSGYRRRDGHLAIGVDGDPVTADSFVPRAILGRYLNWAYGEFVGRMPSQVTVRHHACRAVGIARRSDARFDIALGDGTRLDVDFVFLTTGHSGCAALPREAALERRVTSLRARNRKLAFWRMLDPIEELDQIEPAARVAICGMGLTALDAISMFTHGRGGTFTKAGEKRFRYHPSGREPHITLFSRQGLPLIAKAVDQRVPGRGYVPKVFTRAFVEQLKRRKGKLDWAADLQPCLEEEMALRLACLGSAGEHDPSHTRPSPHHVQAIDAFLRPWNGIDLPDAEAHGAFIRRYLEEDIDASFVGNVAHPFKAIVEMVRDLNDVVRFAVDHCGLTAHSHIGFLNEWCSIANRIAAGPPKERSMELLALIEAGVLCVHAPDPTIELDESAARFKLSSSAFGCAKEELFDVLIQARVGLLRPPTTTDPLIRSGLDRGLFRAFDNDGFAPSGIDIDEHLNVVGADGRPDPNLWAMGYVVEGAHYYTYVLPCPYANSRSLRDAGKAVNAMLKRAASKTQREIVALRRAGDPHELVSVAT